MAESRYVHEYPGAPEGGGEIISVAEGSPFDDAGFTPGCRILSVDGNSLRDVLDWRWYSDGEEITVAYVDTDGEAARSTSSAMRAKIGASNSTAPYSIKSKRAAMPACSASCASSPKTRALRSCCAMTIGA